MLKIYIPHRIKYQDEMYGEVRALLAHAVTTDDLPRWDDLTLKPHLDYRYTDGEPKDDAALLRLAAVRIRDSDVVVFVDRPAADFGDYVWKEVLIAKDHGVPLVVLPDPTGRGPSGLLDEFNVSITEADWTPEGIAEAIHEATY